MLLSLLDDLFKVDLPLIPESVESALNCFVDLSSIGLLSRFHLLATHQ